MFMRGKRAAALALALALTLSLMVLPAAAVSFRDTTNHWARADIEALAAEGIVKGIDSNNFAPDRLMTACEALLFCSRTTGITAQEKADIAAAWSQAMEDLLPADMVSWAGAEMAVCLETGILTASELKALTDSGAIRRSITRESLAMYLVRAMQLAPLAQSLTTYPLGFSDTAAISANLQPYVYLLNLYGIVKGNEFNQFMPKGSLTRAEMAAMLRRARTFMGERGLYAELPQYTDYPWVGGVVAAVNTAGSGVTVLTLNSDLSGTRSFSLTSNVRIYENNMLASASALQVGEYARVNLDSRGAPASVRMGGKLTTYSGAVSELDRDIITIVANGSPRRMEIDRFTEVQAGKSVGDSAVIDLDAGYTNAVCRVDELGHLAMLQLTGGSRQEGGLIAGVTVDAAGGQTLQVAGFSGMTQRYAVPAGTAITVNGLPGVLQASQAGDYVSMRVSNDEAGKVLSLNVDTVTQYVQGSVRAFTTNKSVDTITLMDLGDGRSTTYTLLSGAVIQYEGEIIPLRDLDRNSFATLLLVGGEVSLVDAYPGAMTTEGMVERVTYGSPILLSVRLNDGSTVSFDLPLEDLPVVYRDGKNSSVDQIRVGDAVTVSVRYNQVTQIESTSQTANVTGTVTKVVQDSAGVTLEIRLPGGASETYSVSGGVPVTQDGAAMTVYGLRINDQVALVVSGSQVVSIEVSKSAAANTTLTGTVLMKVEKEEKLMILVEENPVTVDVSEANIIDVATGQPIPLGKLGNGDTVMVYGSYSGAVFKATLVVRTQI